MFEFAKIKYRLFLLASSDVCMPIDIFSLARLIADQYPDQRVQRIIDKYISSDSAFVRRAILTAIKFTGGELVTENMLLVCRHLKDDDPWVAYDAISIIEEQNYITSEVEQLLIDYATEYSSLKLSELNDVKPNMAIEYRNKLAAEILLKRTIT